MLWGAGLQGMIPHPTVRVFLANVEGYYIGTDLLEDIIDNVSISELTIKDIYEYMDSRQ